MTERTPAEMARLAALGYRVAREDDLGRRVQEPAGWVPRPWERGAVG